VGAKYKWVRNIIGGKANDEVRNVFP